MEKCFTLKKAHKMQIQKLVNDMDEQKLDSTLELLTRLNNSNLEITLGKEDKQQINLISSVQQLN